MTATGVITAGRVTHNSGSVDELAAASPASQEAGVSMLCSLPEIDEAFVLSTCNRVEAYVVGADHAVGQAAVEQFFASIDDDALVITDHDESLRHLLRVSAGLESVVLGEDQIIGQVRTAYEDARSGGGIGSMLETAVTKAIHVGERARTETAINEGIVSLGSAATELASTDLSLEGVRSLVVGAGEMGRLAARSLETAGVSKIIIANRTVSHAEHLADEVTVDATAVPLSALETIASDVDVIVTATGSDEPLLEPRHLPEADEPTPETPEQVIVDLGQPRDVEPTAGSLPAIQVYDLDDLESITAQTRSKRADAAREVESMIDYEFALLCDQYKRARADEVIATMYESAEQIKERELEMALSQLGGEGEISDDQRDVLEAMADSLVNQLLAPPTKSLREAASEDDWSTINTALQLFDPGFGDDSPTPPATIAAYATDKRSEAPIGATDDD